MIRTESEYQRTLKQLEEGRGHLEAQRQQLVEAGLDDEALEQAMHPLLTFQAQLVEEVEAFEKLKRGNLGTIESLESLGRWLVGARIAKGWTQKELAERLGVSEAQVSRDERNEYHRVSTEKAQRILDVLGVQFRLEGDAPFTAPQVRTANRPLFAEGDQEGDGSGMIPVDSTPGQVAVFLRADRNLTPDKADKLAQMFRLAYEAAAEQPATERGANPS